MGEDASLKEQVGLYLCSTKMRDVLGSPSLWARKDLKINPSLLRMRD